MIYEIDNNISPDRESKLAEDFEHISFLIHNNVLDEAKTHLLKMHYADIADFLDNTNHKLYRVILPYIADELDPETIVSLNSSSRQPAMEALGIERAASVIDKIYLEDALEIIETLDKEFKEQILELVSLERKKQILEGFKYPENTVGRIIEKDFVVFHKHWTTGQAIDYIRRGNIEYDFYAAIIVDSRFRPVGNILLSTLLKSPRNTPVSELMNSDFKVADAFTEINELAFIFKQYALTIVPVTNKMGKLIGSVSIDNMLYIIEEQAENELMQLGGINASDIFENLIETSKHRFPWLFVNLLTACVTSLIIDNFSDTISHFVILAAVMNIVASVSGNVGTQVMTVTVRAIANREINYANKNKVIIKEIIVSSLNGILIAIIGAGVIYGLFGNLDVCMIFSAAIFANFILGGMLGSCVPLIMNSLKIDPATASGVFVSTFTDALSFLIFLGLAFLLLN